MEENIVGTYGEEDWGERRGGFWSKVMEDHQESLGEY